MHTYMRSRPQYVAVNYSLTIALPFAEDCSSLQHYTFRTSGTIDGTGPINAFRTNHIRFIVKGEVHKQQR